MITLEPVDVAGTGVHVGTICGSFAVGASVGARVTVTVGGCIGVRVGVCVAVADGAAVGVGGTDVISVSADGSKRSQVTERTGIQA